MDSHAILLPSSWGFLCHTHSCTAGIYQVTLYGIKLKSHMSIQHNVCYRRKTRSSDANGLEETLLSGENNDTHKVDYTKWSMDLATDGFLHLVTEPADDIPLADQN